MAKNLDNIKLYGGIDSAVLWAPKNSGVTLPQDLDSELDPGLQDIGWLTEDGTDIEVSVDSGKIVAWQGGTAVAFPVTGSDKAFNFTAMEDTPLVASMFYGAGKPVAAGTGGARLDLPGAMTAIEGSAVVKAVAFDVIKYYVAPLVSITDRGTVGHRNADPTTHQMKLAIRGDAYIITNHPAYVEAVEAVEASTS